MVEGEPFALDVWVGQQRFGGGDGFLRGDDVVGIEVPGCEAGVAALCCGTDGFWRNWFAVEAEEFEGAVVGTDAEESLGWGEVDHGRSPSESSRARSIGPQGGGP